MKPNRVEILPFVPYELYKPNTEPDRDLNKSSLEDEAEELMSWYSGFMDMNIEDVGEAVRKGFVELSEIKKCYDIFNTIRFGKDLK